MSSIVPHKQVAAFGTGFGGVPGSAAFMYKSLGNEKNIRLLRLEPLTERQCNVDLEPYLRVRIITTPLDSAPTYLALSYAWGSSKLCRSILCDDAPILITENLHQALWTVACSIGMKECEMWEKGKAICIWADGICICQSDNTEKGHQVTLMGSIYKKATGVIGYAGAPTSGDPRDAMLGLVSIIDSTNGTTTFPDEKAGSDLYGLNWQGTAFTDQVLQEFWSTPWLTRAWVTQEVALAVELYVVYGYGPNHALWPLHQIDGIDSAVRELGHVPASFGVPATSDSIYRSRMNYYHRAGFRESLLADVKHEWPLVTLLEKNRFTDTTNPKDRIYAVLGLASQADREAIRIDYSDDYTFEQLLIDVSNYCIQQGGIRIILSSAIGDTISTIPSWVTDWGSTAFELCDTFDQYSCSSEATKPFVSRDGLELCVRGYPLDRITKYGPEISNPGARIFEGWVDMDIGDTVSSNHDQFIFLERAASIFQKELSWAQRSPDLAYQKQCYYNYLTIIATPVAEEDSLSDASISGEAPLGGLRKDIWRAYTLAKYRWQYSGMRTEDPMRIHNLENTLFRSMCVFKGMKLAMTRCGRLAVVPVATQMSDIVVILCGIHHRFVLRPMTNYKYKLIGLCYLHGVMRGEMEPSLPTERVEGRMMEQDFVLI